MRLGIRIGGAGLGLALMCVLSACGNGAGLPQSSANAASPPIVTEIITSAVAEPVADLAASSSVDFSDFTDEDTELYLFDLFGKAEASQGPGEPALWAVSDHDSTVYLFGTVHALRPKTQWLTPTIQDAFDRSDRLIIEVDIFTTAAQAEYFRLIRHYGLFAHGRSLFEYVSDDQTEELKRYAKKLDIPFDSFMRFKPWLLKDILSGETEYERGANAFERASGVESILVKAAHQRGMTLGYIESLDDQLSILPSASMEEQVVGLFEALKQSDYQPDLLDRLVSEWVEGDVDGLGMIVTDPIMQTDPDHFDALLRGRNAKWIPKLKIMLDIPGTSFVAVGAAHLAGPDSVINMLDAEGIKALRQ